MKWRLEKYPSEFLTRTIGSEPKVGLANLNQSEMALFSECWPQCA